jgi:signal transduction histidine kinase
MENLKIVMTLQSENHQVAAMDKLNAPESINWIAEINNILNGVTKRVQFELESDYSFFERSSNQLSVVILMSTLLSVYLLVIHQISSRNLLKQREQEKHEIISARTEAVFSSNLKSKFLATVSHEIRTPLNGIIGLSDILRRSDLTPEATKIAGSIFASGQNLLGIINDILDYSKIESGRVEIDSVPFDVREVVDQVLLILNPKAQEKSLRLEAHFEGAIPRLVKGDPSRLSQILFNLIGNAIKFTSSGGVSIRVNGGSSPKPGRTRLLIAVEDTGVGISSDMQKQLFIAFNPLQKVGTSGEAGSGLGLSISQNLVKLMGSELKVRSEVGKGTTFSCEIDFEIAPQDLSEEIASQNEKSKLERVSPIQKIFAFPNIPRVLAVEDNVTNQITLKAILDRLGADTIVVGNGEEAVAAVSQQSFDIVIMDCYMPIMDGFDATRVIKSKYSYLPIIAMTANAFQENEAECLAAGMDGFLTKPITVNALTKELRWYLLPPADRIFLSPIKRLQKTLGGESTSLIITSFCDSIESVLVDLEALRRAGDIKGLHGVAHSLKSSSASVGAMGLSYLFKRLEKAETMATAIPLLEEFKSSAASVKQQLAIVLRKQELNKSV